MKLALRPVQFGLEIKQAGFEKGMFGKDNHFYVQGNDGGTTFMSESFHNRVEQILKKGGGVYVALNPGQEFTTQGISIDTPFPDEIMKYEQLVSDIPDSDPRQVYRIVLNA